MIYLILLAWIITGVTFMTLLVARDYGRIMVGHLLFILPFGALVGPLALVAFGAARLCNIEIWRKK